VNIKNIKPYRLYVDKDGTARRLVLGIGPQFAPGSHPVGGVWFEQTQWVDGCLRVSYGRLYLDTFAQWARREIK